MIKQDLSDVPALSCVENYFLAYFKTKFDIRVLYVDSYRSVNKVLEDFLQHMRVMKITAWKEYRICLKD